MFVFDCADSFATRTPGLASYCSIEEVRCAHTAYLDAVHRPVTGLPPLSTAVDCELRTVCVYPPLREPVFTPWLGRKRFGLEVSPVRRFPPLTEMTPSHPVRMWIVYLETGSLSVFAIMYFPNSKISVASTPIVSSVSSSIDSVFFVKFRLCIHRSAFIIRFGRTSRGHIGGKPHRFFVVFLLHLAPAAQQCSSRTYVRTSSFAPRLRFLVPINRVIRPMAAFYTGSVRDS